MHEGGDGGLKMGAAACRLSALRGKEGPGKGDGTTQLVPIRHRGNERFVESVQFNQNAAFDASLIY